MKPSIPASSARVIDVTEEKQAEEYQRFKGIADTIGVKPE